MMPGAIEPGLGLNDVISFCLFALPKNWKHVDFQIAKGIVGLSTRSTNYFLHSRIRSIQSESIVVVKKFELEILTNLHVLDLPESKNTILELGLSVSELDNSKTIRATGMKFGM
ncbi:hypothetical protein AVEN_50427-1 [Araneus ventricosus]|uniref:Uncharacterized protein n=1 Tax=Araneus ventricosus TaxID=182803 RepID=A0A4Y2ES23_ARAVE|nr:hypothetical protein AVEN_50427-1 [Araneus ventricosus]